MEISHLPATNTKLSSDFRMRGQDMTRIEAFVAAAFAFAITMLVISVGSIPETFHEFVEAIKQIPAFAASCATIFWIWHSHANWSRRYGLEDTATIVLSGVLIFLVLIYIYPLRLVMQGFFSFLSGGLLPFTMALESNAQLTIMFIFYGIGFTLLSLNFVLLHWHALRTELAIPLNGVERFDTKTDLMLWMSTSLICLVVTILCWLLPGRASGFANFGYFLLGPTLTWISYKRNKMRVNQAI